MFKSQGLCQTCGEKACHPERSEGSLRPGNEILRCAQDDRPDSTHVRSREVFSPNVYILNALMATSRFRCSPPIYRGGYIQKGRIFTMSVSLIERTPSAYDYPLLIKHLLYTPLATAPEQEIVYRDISRYTYRTLHQRIGRLASGLAGLGVKPGDTVAVMDWDSHRYLECYFAIPMMGAVLEMINIRLSPEQILYTLNHAGADVILCHTDFLPVLDSIKDRLETAKTFILLSDEGERPQSSVAFAAEYEELLARSAEPHDESGVYDFPDFDENTRATTFYTTGTTGNPKGVYFSHRQLVLHTLAVLGSLASTPEHQRFHRGDVYMPITPMFHVHAWGAPYVATAMGTKQVYPGRYLPDLLLALIQREKVTFSHCVPTILHMMLSSPASQNIDLSGWKVVIGGSALS